MSLEKSPAPGTETEGLDISTVPFLVCNLLEYPFKDLVI